ncbi:hypothetical protein BH23ACT11_BH23ACT11_06640 [soil metagenome]
MQLSGLSSAVTNANDKKVLTCRGNGLFLAAPTVAEAPYVL